MTGQRCKGRWVRQQRPVSVLRIWIIRMQLRRSYAMRILHTKKKPRSWSWSYWHGRLPRHTEAPF